MNALGCSAGRSSVLSTQAARQPQAGRRLFPGPLLRDCCCSPASSHMFWEAVRASEAGCLAGLLCTSIGVGSNLQARRSSLCCKASRRLLPAPHPPVLSRNPSTAWSRSSPALHPLPSFHQLCHRS